MKKYFKLYNSIKSFLQKMASLKKGEISYEEFEKLESKKYSLNQPRSEQVSIWHHPYSCTNECFNRPKNN